MARLAISQSGSVCRVLGVVEALRDRVEITPVVVDGSQQTGRALGLVGIAAKGEAFPNALVELPRTE